ncbi:ABC transporter permease [Acidisoma silvae]|uniref:ABC transporter permease n=1 Tax=Acidisoma silvae TaxID=2802396 RepID=A0A963YWK7_9PROT|nr:ABC transporter permease [Acidisoma silvae]MCB8877478.1 ABC transporter permease [Acidisoma silvae]
MRFLKSISKIPPTALLGMVVVFAYIFVAAFAHWVAPYGQFQIVGDQYSGWSDKFLLGTDNLGRDMFSRIVYGARNTVGVALLITFLSFSVGCTFGIVAAIRGGWVDAVLSWAVDILMSIPQLIFAMLLLTILGTSLPVLITVVALLDSTRVFRLARSVARNLVVLDFVEAVQLRGEGFWWIARHELLPNMVAPLTAEFGIRFCFVFLFIAALSFLGIGVQPPTADWGSMIRDNATLITFGDITPVIPGLAIACLTIAVNFIVDWILGKTGGSRV